MKTVLSVLCCIGIAVLLTSCKGDDDGSNGGNGDFPDVSFVKTTKNGVEVATCYNADNNVITTDQVCTWNCAYYHSSQPRWVQLTFDNGLVCEQTGIDATTGLPTQTCTSQFALVKERFGPCVL